MTDMTADIVDTLHQPVLVLDDDLSVTVANRAFCKCFDVSEEETVGRPLYALGDNQWDIAELHTLLADILGKNTKVTNYRVEHDFGSIGRRVMLLNGRRLWRDHGNGWILLAISDITDRERMESELIARAELSEKLFDSIREAVLVLDPDLRVRSANQPFYDLFGVPREESEGKPVYELGNRQWDIPALRQALEQVLPRQHRFDDFEVSHDFAVVGHRTMILNGRRLDNPPRILLAIRDVTEERRMEADQTVMIGELQHRVKNLLSNIQAIAHSTLRGSKTLEEFKSAYFGRIMSLARAQDLLMRGASDYVSLEEIVRIELEAHGLEADGKLSIDGEAVPLTRRETQAVSMLLHELATNAVKYGAYANPEGVIAISWRIDRSDPADCLVFDWRETGVPIETPPAYTGFGTDLIKHGVSYMLGGTSDLEFTSHGLVCMVSFPISQAGSEKRAL
jgi:PAS domain S-box-containing protein